MTVRQESKHIEHRRNNYAERQRLKGLWWAAVLIWAGLIFGADSLGFLPQIGVGNAWSWIFTGAGLLGIIGSIYRVTSPDVSNPTIWDWVWPGFCLIIGVGGFTRLEIAFPLILILAGVASLAGFYWRRD